MSAQRKSIFHILGLVAVVVAIAGVGLLLDLPPRAGFHVLGEDAHLLLTDVLIAVVLAVSLNLILGMAGQFSLGHAGFLAAGAYTCMVIAGKPEFLLPQLRLWLGLGLPASVAFSLVFVAGAIAAMLVCAALGYVVGLPALRLRGDYLAIATLGFGEIVSTLITNSSYLGGATGLELYGMRSIWAYSPEGRGSDLAKVVEAQLRNPYQISTAWVLGAAVLTVWVVRNIKYSTTGRALLAIREDVIASEAVGVPTTRHKVGAFVIGAVMAGMAGAILSHHKALNPESFRFMRSIEIVLMVILGGQGSITGAVLAAAALTLVPEGMRRAPWINPDLVDKWRMVVYSLLIILAMLFRPQGILGRYEINDLVGWAYRRIRGIRLALPKAAARDKVAREQIPGETAADMVVLEARGVGMSFGGVRAVDGFSLTLRPRELVGLIGPNGAGKTTVFNVLTGVYRPTDGEILFHGQSVVGLKPHRISKAGVARTFQNIRLFGNLSVLDNVMIAQHAHHRQGMPSSVLRTPGFYREEALSREVALELLGIFHLAHLAGERANALSYGDQRRLEIARALAARPKLLLLDEPAAGMNPTEKRQLMEMIRWIRDQFGLTILLIEHDMKVVMGVCQRIVVLDYGKMIASGTPEEIRKNPAVIEAYLGASAKQG